MIKMIQRVFFYAAFVLCAVFVFADDDSNAADETCVKVYDAKDKLVCELTRDKDLEAFSDFLMESIDVATDNAAFAQAPKNAKIAYQYELFDDSSTPIRLFIYTDRKTAYMPNIPKDSDMPEVLAWELFGEAYKILSQPTLLKKAIGRYKNRNKNIFVYDAKGFLISSARIPSVSDILRNILEDYSDDAENHELLGGGLPDKSVHEGKLQLYRYTIWDDDETIRLYVYSDTNKVVITQSFPDWGECTLSKDGYALFSDPEQLLEQLKDEAGL